MNNWCIFYVSSYKGGELMENINISEEAVVSTLSYDVDFLMDYLDDTKNVDISDEDLWQLWEEWYNAEEQHNLYAYNSHSEMQIYQIKDNKLVEAFPSKECIIKCLRTDIENWKKWRQKS